MKTTIEWNTVDKIPDPVIEPIVCITRNNKVVVFKNTERRMWHQTGSWISYSNFTRLVDKYKVVYWAYQKDLINGTE